MELVRDGSEPMLSLQMQKHTHTHTNEQEMNQVFLGVHECTTQINKSGADGHYTIEQAVDYDHRHNPWCVK